MIVAFERSTLMHERLGLLVWPYGYGGEPTLILGRSRMMKIEEEKHRLK